MKNANTPETKIYYFADGKIYRLSLEDYLMEYFPEKWENGGFDSAFYAATNGMVDAPPFYDDLAELYEGLGYDKEDCQFMASTTIFEGISAEPALSFIDALFGCFEGVDYSIRIHNREGDFVIRMNLTQFMNCVELHKFLQGAQRAKVLPFIEGIFMTDYKYAGKELHVSIYETLFGASSGYMVDLTIY